MNTLNLYRVDLKVGVTILRASNIKDAKAHAKDLFRDEVENVRQATIYELEWFRSKGYRYEGDVVIL